MPDGENSRARLLGSAAAAAAPEALLVCPECRVAFQPGILEAHLRQVHQIYQFRGIRRSFNDTFAALLDALLLDPPDAEAWCIMSAIAVEEHGSRAAIFLARTLGQLLKRIEPDRQTAEIDALGAVIGRSGATDLTLTLASDTEIPARQLALAVFAHLPQPIDAMLLPPLRSLLLDRRLPHKFKFPALAAALRAFGKDGPLAEELLRTLFSRRGKAKSIERLRRFEKYAGPHPAIEVLCEKLENRLRMSCPRCGIQLRRRKMIEHLWNEHRLVLDSRRVREPWGLLDEWVNRYCEQRQPELLERCRALVQRFDAEEAAQRFHRLLLSRGIADEEARRALTEKAAQQHAACCPWCYALVPVPREVPPLRLNQYRGRLSAGGYRVEVSERGLLTSLDIVTPKKTIYRGREPGQTLTSRGAMIVFVGPLVFLALLRAFGAQPLVPVLAILLLALVVHLVMHWLWKPRVPAGIRARNYAWTILVPQLHKHGFSLEDSAFLAGLANLSCADGYGPLREALLPDLLRRTESALAMGLAPPGHLAALRRLMVEDAAARGADPVPLIVDLLARCFAARFSLRFADHLLAGWETGDEQDCESVPRWWTSGNRARLRVLLCDRAFEAGFEVRNLLDAGQNAPALGHLLGVSPGTGEHKEKAYLAALRLLWSLRPVRPWDRCGEPLTVFDLAADPQHSELLGRFPDLLLWHLEPNWLVAAPGDTEPKPVQILFCLRGIFLQGVLFAEPPSVVEVNARWRYNDLIIGEQRFRSPASLDMLALRMERWFRYAFSDFLPNLPRVEKWQAPDRLAILRAWGAVACPECHRQLLPRVGQVGIALEEGPITNYTDKTDKN